MSPCRAVDRLSQWSGGGLGGQGASRTARSRYPAQRISSSAAWARLPCLLPSRPHPYWSEQEHSWRTSSRKRFSLASPNRVDITARRSPSSLSLVGSSVKLARRHF